MPALTIRPSTGPAEYPALVAIWRGAVDATHDFLAAADRDEIEAALPSAYLPAVALSVAERDGRPVGFSGVLDGTLEMLFVDATLRGGGVGTALLTQAIREGGVTRSTSTSRTSRLRASTSTTGSRSSVAARPTRPAGPTRCST